MYDKIKISMMALMFLMMGQGANAWEGSGTAETPYQINSIADLNELATNVNSGTSYSGKYFKLTANLDYSSVQLTNGSNFTPIGWGDNSEGKAFSGHFDGNRKTISGIIVDMPEGWGVGVFGYISKASIKNLTVTNSKFIGNGFVGGICGCSDKADSNLNPVIENCHVASTVTLGATDFAVGGIIGINDDNLTIKDCTSAAVITSTDVGIGGIIGVAYEDVYMATITDSYYVGNANLPAIGENGGHNDSMEKYATINITLLDNDSEATVKNATRISNYTGMTANVTLSSRTLYKDNSWNTLCLPFPIALEGSPLEGATLMELDADGEHDGNKTGLASNGTLHLYFKDATTIEAGKPYIIKWASGGGLFEPTFTGVTVSSTSAATVTASNTGYQTVEFRGSYSSVARTAVDKASLYLGAGNNLYYPSVNMTINACRAYFHVDLNGTVNAVRAFSLHFGDDSDLTGIASVSTNSKDNAAWYTLDGRKLDGKPTARGLYINNGRKIVIK